MEGTVSTLEASEGLTPQQDQGLGEKTQSLSTDGTTPTRRTLVEQQKYSKDTSTNTKQRKKSGLGKTNDWKNRRINSKSTYTGSMSLLEKLDKMPPFLCRLLARRKGKSLSNRQLASDLGVSVRTIQRISEKKSWDDVPVGFAQKFSGACGVDLLRQNKSMDYFKRRKFNHIKKSPNVRYFNKLLKIWKEM
tara:strand:+ start:1289 stop:1861 length:573 start_codon:yes stop_codon:yes gene_type:complete